MVALKASDDLVQPAQAAAGHPGGKHAEAVGIPLKQYLTYCRLCLAHWCGRASNVAPEAGNCHEPAEFRVKAVEMATAGRLYSSIVNEALSIFEIVGKLVQIVSHLGSAYRAAGTRDSKPCGL